MASEIPVSFDYKGKHYKGHFNEMLGATSWHLMINNYFCGQLIYHKDYGFHFYSNKPRFEDLSDYFGELIMLWYE